MTHPETTPMNEPVWLRSDGFLDLMVPNGPPWVDRTHFGYIRKHVRKRLYYAHAGDETQTFHELEEAKAWLLTTWRLT